MALEAQGGGDDAQTAERTDRAVQAEVVPDFERGSGDCGKRAIEHFVGAVCRSPSSWSAGTAGPGVVRLGKTGSTGVGRGHFGEWGGQVADARTTHSIEATEDGTVRVLIQIGMTPHTRCHQKKREHRRRQK